MSPSQRAAAERLIAEHPTLFMNDLPDWCDDAFHLLRELAAGPVVNQQMTTEPVQEPVAWRSKTRINGEFDSGWHLTSTEPPQTPRTIAIEPLYTAPEQRKPLTPSMQAEVECDCLVAWNASTYGHSAQDTVHPRFLSAFLRGYRAAERAHGITGEPT